MPFSPVIFRVSCLAAVVSLSVGVAAAPNPEYRKSEREYWAFQPRSTAAPPAFDDAEAQRLGARPPSTPSCSEKLRENGPRLRRPRPSAPH